MMGLGGELKRMTGQDPLFMPWRMAPSGGDFAHMTGETMLSFAQSNMDDAVKAQLDDMIKNYVTKGSMKDGKRVGAGITVGDWPGIDSPDVLQKWGELPDVLRKELKNAMDVQFRKKGGLGIGEARLAVSDPTQLTAPAGGLQNVGLLYPDSPVIATSGHPSYPAGVPGQGVGRLIDPPLVTDLLQKDATRFESDVGGFVTSDWGKDRGIIETPTAEDLRALQMKPYGGVITEDLLRNLSDKGYEVGNADPRLLAAIAGGGGLAASLLAPEAEAGFAGRLAKGADEFMMSVAGKMEDAGVSPDEIWQKTGWGRGADNKWRFEFDDRQAEMLPRDLEPMSGVTNEFGEPVYPNWEGHLGDYMRHPELEQQYNLMERTNVNERPGTGGSLADFGTSPITGNRSYGITIGKDGGRRSTALHEIQHAIQSEEGFARGGASGGKAWLMDDVRPQIVDEYSRIVDNLQTPLGYEDYKRSAGWEGYPEADAKAAYEQYVKDARSTKLDPSMDRDVQEQAGRNIYHRLAGEAEARNVEKRADWTPQQRRSTPPWESSDVPYDQQIVRHPRRDISERGSANPYLLAGTGAGVGSGLLAAQAGDRDMVRAPKHPRLAEATMAARGLERRLEGSPASLLYPEGTVNWLERLAYGDRPTWMERGGILLDWL
jgi:hypothetical protein